MSGFTDEQRDEIKELIREVIREELSIAVESGRDYYTKSLAIKLELKDSDNFSWKRDSFSEAEFSMRDLV
jgi:hypothetical protein